MTIQILKRRSLEAGADSRFGMSGEYRLIVRRADGSIRQDTGFFSNLILDAGLNRIGTATAEGRCEIGTGTAAPAANQTALATLSAGTTDALAPGYSASVAPPYYLQYTTTYRFAVGALNGNYTEVGIGWASNQLFSRALIVDGGGLPTSITVLSTEQLDVVYRLRMYYPTSDWGGTYSIGGVSTTVAARGAHAGNPMWQYSGSPLAGNVSPLPPTGIMTTAVYTGSLGLITGSPSGSSANTGASPVNTAYSNNSLTRVSTVNLGLGVGNIIGGISAFGTEGSQGLLSTQWEFSPPIAKDATKTLALTFSATWARR